MKNIATALSLACLLGTTTFAAAEVTHHRVHHHRLIARTAMPAVHTISADGRCDGVSYGTGARRCGTGTGGPSGGLESRN